MLPGVNLILNFVLKNYLSSLQRLLKQLEKCRGCGMSSCSKEGRSGRNDFFLLLYAAVSLQVSPYWLVKSEKGWWGNRYKSLPLTSSIVEGLDLTICGLKNCECHLR